MLNSREVLDRYYLDTRCKLIEIAAMLDRYDRADGADGAAADPRLPQLYQSLQILSQPAESPERARTLLELFSDTD